MPVEEAPTRDTHPENITEYVAQTPDMDVDKFVGNLPASSCVHLLELYRDSPQVIVIVEDRSYKLPKSLLCSKSTFFNKAFNGPFLEGQEQTMTLETTSPNKFDRLVQWIWFGNVVPESPNDEIGVVTQLAEFLVLANFVDLRGPFSAIISTIRTIVTRDQDLIQPQHIRISSELPKGHELRKLFAQGCVWHYAYSLREGTEFRLQSELDDLEEFRDDLFCAFSELFKSVRSNNGVIQVKLRHPMTGVYMIMQ